MTTEHNQNVSAIDDSEVDEGVKPIDTTQTFIADLQGNVSAADARLTSLEGKLASLVAQLNAAQVESDVFVSHYIERTGLAAGTGTRWAGIYTKKAYTEITFQFFTGFNATSGSTPSDHYQLQVINNSAGTILFTHTTDNGEILPNLKGVGFTIQDVPADQHLVWEITPTGTPATLVKGFICIMHATPARVFSV